MRFLSPTSHKRLNEGAGFLFLSAGVLLWLSLLSYHAQDASWNTAAGEARPENLIGYVGSHLSDLALQTFGLAAFVFPVLLLLLAWKWIRSDTLEAPFAKAFGCTLFILSASTAFSLGPEWRLYHGAISAGGLAGRLLADYLRAIMNLTGAAVFTATCLIVSIYLASTFTIAKLHAWFSGPLRVLGFIAGRWRSWRARRRERKLQKQQERARLRRLRAGPPAEAVRLAET